ncbi:hypothetical protein Ancab_017398 [Ancistrocladus abbreviatus]
MGYYYYGRRPYNPSILDYFYLPFPLILFTIVIFLFLGISVYFSFAETAESTGTQINWLLLATPVLLIFAVRWLSSMQDPMCFFGLTPYERRRRACWSPRPADGASPWGVAAMILLVLVLLQFQSIFLERWFV